MVYLPIVVEGVEPFPSIRGRFATCLPCHANERAAPGPILSFSRKARRLPELWLRCCRGTEAALYHATQRPRTRATSGTALRSRPSQEIAFPAGLLFWLEWLQFVRPP